MPRIGRWDLHNSPTETDVLKTLAGFSLDAAPGARYTYSNVGFSLLGFAAGRAAHTTARDLIQRRLLTPLGMTSTVWEASAVPADKLPTPYDRGPKDEPKQMESVRLGAAEASGGMYSTVRDMARYVAFQLAAYPPRNAPESGPVRRSTVREAHATGYRSGLNVALEDAPERGAPLVRASTTSYGFGWVQEQNCDFDDLVSHGGWIDGFKANIRFLPSRGVGVIAFANFAAADPDSVSNKVLRALLQSGGLAKRSLLPSPELQAAMKKLLAVYEKWDDDAYAAMLSANRPKQPNEREELAGYRMLHGACRGFSPLQIDSPTRGRFAVECERGAFQMALDISASDGGITGFTGKSLDADVSKQLRAVAGDIASLIGKWDDKIYKLHLAQRANKPQAETATFFDKLRAAHGACTVKTAVHEGFDQWFELDCDRGGGLTLSLTLDPNDEAAIQKYLLRPAARGTCPVR